MRGRPPFIRFRISTKDHGLEAEGNGHLGVIAIFALAVAVPLIGWLYFAA